MNWGKWVLQDTQLYCDTSLIIEALEDVFSDGYETVYPATRDGRSYRTLMRGFASYWTDVRCLHEIVDRRTCAHAGHSDHCSA